MNMKEYGEFLKLAAKVAALEKRVDELEAKKGPGRPPKTEQKAA